MSPSTGIRMGAMACECVVSQCAGKAAEHLLHDTLAGRQSPVNDRLREPCQGIMTGTEECPSAALASLMSKLKNAEHPSALAR